MTKNVDIHVYGGGDKIFNKHFEQAFRQVGSTFMHFVIFLAQFNNYLLFRLNRRIHYIK